MNHEIVGVFVPAVGAGLPQDTAELPPVLQSHWSPNVLNSLPEQIFTFLHGDFLWYHRILVVTTGGPLLTALLTAELTGELVAGEIDGSHF